MNKIKLLEKNGAIDANGKYVVKDPKSHQNDMKNMESLQTISIY